MKKLLIHHSLIILCLTSFLCPHAHTFQDRPKVNISRSTAGGIALAGVISLTTSETDGLLNLAGWCLLFTGVLGLVQIESDAHAYHLDSDQVYKHMIRDAKVMARNPEIVQGEGITFALEEFEADLTLTQSQKAKLFAQTVLAVDKKAQEIKTEKTKNPGYFFSTRKIIEEILGKNVSPKNIEAMEKLLFLAGVTA